MIIRKHSIIKVQKNRAQTQTESIIQDKIVSISINTHPPLQLHTIHGNEKSLVNGYLYIHHNINNESPNCIINEESNHYKIQLDEDKQLTMDHPSQIEISPIDIFKLTAMFQEKSLLFKQLGICESIALCSPHHIESFAEDISDEAAFFKAIGLSLKSKPESLPPILLTSAYISLNIMKHAKKCNIQIIISRTSAPMSVIEYAQEHNITIVSYARGMKFSILTHPNRINRSKNQA